MVTSPEEFDYSSSKYKLVLLGERGVGKTSIVNRFVYDKYNYKYEATLGVDFLSKRVNIEKRSVRLQVWDTAGQESFRCLIPSYIKNSHVAVIVYDITDMNSFRQTQKWVNDAKKERDNDVILVLVGNKADMTEMREVDRSEALDKAKEYNALFIETSAENGFNVNKLFEDIAQVLPIIEPNDSCVLSQEKSGQINYQTIEQSLDQSPHQNRCKC
jgi:small GTP-binding protein